MNEFSFIGFNVVDDGCDLQLPIHTVSDLRFFIPETQDGNNLASISLWDYEGAYIRDCEYDFDSGFVSLKNTSISDLTCFRIGFNYEGSTYYMSNLFRYVSDTSETVLVKYLCSEAQFGFDYTIDNSYNQVRLPILARLPQFPQEDKVYIDGNGVRRLLYSKVDKEYNLETEYIPEDWHEKLIIALSHDEVYFDGERLQKSAAYEINYDEFDELPCGTRLYKASAKLSKNVTQRNNNC